MYYFFSRLSDPQAFERLVRDYCDEKYDGNCIRILSPHLRWGTRWSRSFA